ncbi:hypothetical protein [Cupriavidus pauculus]|uniref:hypothetical protein n=1 Tax=Cupriavidus pauculus TaxID=82633 RepID=UPI001EE1771D|nr:hypothetical protein [Cupriavidus pauculus]GJG94768.1 hypothetical protein CBA19C6_09785 [Cupriavidus pauculus]
MFECRHDVSNDSNKDAMSMLTLNAPRAAYGREATMTVSQLKVAGTLCAATIGILIASMTYVTGQARDMVIASAVPLVSRLDRVDVRLDRMDGRIDRMDGRIDGLELRMGKLEDRMGHRETRMDNFEVRMEKIEIRMERVETSIAHLRTDVDKLIGSVAALTRLVERQASVRANNESGQTESWGPAVTLGADQAGHPPS